METSAADIDPLVEAIPRRQCTRSVYDGRSPPTDELALIARAAAIEGVEVRLLTARSEIDAVRAYVITTGCVFFVIVLLHRVRVLFEGAHMLRDPGFIVTTVIAIALVIWAWRPVRR